MVGESGGGEPDQLVALQEDAPPERGEQQPGAKPADPHARQRLGGGEHDRQEHGVEELGGDRPDQPLDPRQERLAAAVTERGCEQHHRREQEQQQREQRGEQQPDGDVPEQAQCAEGADGDHGQQREARERSAGLLQLNARRRLLNLVPYASGELVLLGPREVEQRQRRAGRDDPQRVKEAAPALVAFDELVELAALSGLRRILQPQAGVRCTGLGLLVAVVQRPELQRAPRVSDEDVERAGKRGGERGARLVGPAGRGGGEDPGAGVVGQGGGLADGLLGRTDDEQPEHHQCDRCGERGDRLRVLALDRVRARFPTARSARSRPAATAPRTPADAAA